MFIEGVAYLKPEHRAMSVMIKKLFIVTRFQYP